MLEEMGLTYDLIVIDRENGEHERPDYKRIHPLGEVPALVDDEHVVIEPTAICMYLADRFPERKMAPTIGDPERARYYQFMVFSEATVEPIVRTIFEHTVTSPDPVLSPPVVAATLARWRQVGGVLEHAVAGRAYFVAERMTALDVILGSILLWANQMEMLDDLPDLKSYAHYLASRPAYKRAGAGPKKRFQLKTLE